MATFSLLYKNKSFEGTCCFHLQGAGPSVILYTTSVSQMRLLKHDAGRAPRRAGFDVTLVQVGFVVDKVAVGQVFLPVGWFSPVRIIPSLLHTYSSQTICYLSI
jgi:hypothetical protein